MASYFSNQKLIYFRYTSNISSDDHFSDSGSYSPNDILGFLPDSNINRINVRMQPIVNQDTDGQGNNFLNTDAMILVVESAAIDKRDIMEAIVTAINDPASNPLITIGDDVTEEYIHPAITAVERAIRDRIF
jgi:hypothetical protein